MNKGEKAQYLRGYTDAVAQIKEEIENTDEEKAIAWAEWFCFGSLEEWSESSSRRVPPTLAEEIPKVKGMIGKLSEGIHKLQRGEKILKKEKVVNIADYRKV